MRVFIAGFHHETNTFAPTKADWAAASPSAHVTRDAFERIADIVMQVYCART